MVEPGGKHEVVAGTRPQDEHSSTTSTSQVTDRSAGSPASTEGSPVSQERQKGLSRVASSNALAAVAARLSALAVGMILTPFVLHRLGREMYGVVITVSAIYEYLSLLRGGINGALRRFVTLHHHAGRIEEARRFYAAGFWWGVLMRVIILGIGLVLAQGVAGYLRIPESSARDATIGVMLIFVACVLADQATSFEIPIYATGRIASISLIRAFTGWGRLGLTVLAFALMSVTLQTYSLAIVGADLLLMILLGARAQRSGVVRSVIPAPTLGAPELRSTIFRYGGLAMLAQAAAILYVATDNLLIGRIYGAGAVTQYSLGTRWTPIIIGFLSATLSGLTPIFTSLEARGESARGRQALTRVVALTSALAVPAFLVPCVIGDLFLVNWVGPEYRSSHQYMIAMLVPAAIEGALAPLWMALLARGRIGWIAAADIIGAVANVLISLFLALVLKLGLLGFALGNTCAYLGKNLLLRPIVVRKDGTLPPMSEILKPLLKALAGASPGLLLLFLARPWIGGSLPAVIAAGLAGAALSVTGSLLLAVGRRELARLAQLLPLGPLRPLLARGTRHDR